jgi:peptidoglycan/LPS O-acetylase OafA/YrhL
LRTLITCASISAVAATWGHFSFRGVWTPGGATRFPDKAGWAILILTESDCGAIHRILHCKIVARASSSVKQGDVGPALSPEAGVQASHRIGYLDGWRGVAILMVLIGHFYPVSFLNLGNTGVDFFFCLSGRLMADILFVKNVALPEFYLRRLSRIYPGLLGFVLLAAMLFFATPLHVGPLAILSALSFTINYAAIYLHRTGIFDHLWSLCVEEHSYVLLGALTWLHRKTHFNVPAVLFAIGMLAVLNGIYQYRFLGHGYFEVYWRTDVQLAPIFIAASLFLAFRDHAKFRLAWLCPACLVMALICKSNIAPAEICYSFGTLFLAAAVASIQYSERYLRAFFAFAPLRQFGIWSYSLYLWQQPFYLCKSFGSVPTELLLAASLLSGLLSFYLIEEPARTYLNKRIGKYRAQKLPSPVSGVAGL